MSSPIRWRLQHFCPNFVPTRINLLRSPRSLNSLNPATSPIDCSRTASQLLAEDGTAGPLLALRLTDALCRLTAQFLPWLISLDTFLGSRLAVLNIRSGHSTFSRLSLLFR